MKYVDDDSATFWAIGRNSIVLAAHVGHCGKEVLMFVPFEGTDSAEVLFFTSLEQTCHTLFFLFIILYHKFI